MQRMSVSNIVPTAHLAFHILHDSGELLLPAGSHFDESMRRVLEACHIEQVYLLDRFDNVTQFHIAQKNKYILVDELTPEHQIAAPICESGGTILLGSKTVVDGKLKERLKSLGYYTVCVRKNTVELSLHQVRSFHNRKVVARIGNRTRRSLVAVD